MRLSLRQAATLLALGAIWGASFLFLKLAVPVLGVDATIGARLLLGAGFLSLVAWQQKAAWLGWQDLRQNARHYLVLGVLNSALPFWLFAWSAQALPAGLLAIFNSTAPIWASLLAASLGQSGLGLWRALGLLLGVAGVVAAVGGVQGSSAGSANDALHMGTALAAAFSYGSASVYAAWLGRQKQARGEAFDAFAHAHGSMWLGGLAAVVVLGLVLGVTAAAPSLAPAVAPAVASAVAPALATPTPAATPFAELALALAAAAGLGLLCTGLAYLWYFKLILELGAVSAMSVAFLIPIFGILWGVLFLGEPMSPGLLLGALMVLVGTGLAARPAKTSPGHPSPKG